MRQLPKQADANVLVGFDTSDDAGVYRLSPECALVQTVDFFTPIVDDPYTYGAIAAANSLSDVYAMGGRPITALSIVAFPGNGDASVLASILQGGLSKMVEAGCTVVGGHSVSDPEVKFGYSVTGVVHPDKVWANAGARPGDLLVLTKPIGTGITATAGKRGAAAESHLAGAVESMLRLNKAAAERLADCGIHGCTVALMAARGGLKVALVERGALCREASGVNAGTLTLQMTRVALIPYALRAHAMWADAPNWLGHDVGVVVCDGLSLAFTEREEELLSYRAGKRREAGAPI